MTKPPVRRSHPGLFHASRSKRLCKKSFGERAEHDAGGLEEDHGFAGSGIGFVVAGESAGLHEPAEGAFDDPAFGLDDEAFGRGVGAFDDVQPQCGMRGVRAQILGEGAAGVARVGPELFEPRLDAQHGREHLQGSGAIGDLSPGDADAKDQSQGIYHQMPFSPSDLLSRIVASHSGVVSHLNTLRVEDRSARGFFFARFSRTASRR